MRFSCFRYFIDRHENSNELPVTFLISCSTSKSLENIIFIIIALYHSSFKLCEGNALPNTTRNPLYELCSKGVSKNGLFLFFSLLIPSDYRKIEKQSEPLICKIFFFFFLRQIISSSFLFVPCICVLYCHLLY